jgi:hypothetical protein
MAKNKCLRKYYTRATEDELDSIAAAVKEGLDKHASIFPAPAVSVAAMEIIINNYTITLNAYRRGGLDQKPAFASAKTALLDALESNATYVDSIANGNEDLIVKGGYISTRLTKTRLAAPAKPTGVKATRSEASGSITLQCTAQQAADVYGAIIAEGAPLTHAVFSNGRVTVPANTAHQIVVDTNRQRKKEFTGLKPGITYHCYMFCSNRNGCSALSDGISIMVV